MQTINSLLSDQTGVKGIMFNSFKNIVKTARKLGGAFKLHNPINFTNPINLRLFFSLLLFLKEDGYLLAQIAMEMVFGRSWCGHCGYFVALHQVPG
jgi:hypothetical protein